MSTFWLSIIIGALSLDTSIAFQMLFSQPIFACTLIGWALGDPLTGMQIGALMQLLWINVAPMGATMFPEGNVASMVVAAITVREAAPVMEESVFTIAFIIGVAVSITGAWLTVLDRNLNGKILQYALKAAQTAGLKRIMALDVLSILIYFLLMSALAFAAITCGEALIESFPETLLAWNKKVSLVKPAIWGVGIALSIRFLAQAWRQQHAK